MSVCLRQSLFENLSPEFVRGIDAADFCAVFFVGVDVQVFAASARAVDSQARSAFCVFEFCDRQFWLFHNFMSVHELLPNKSLEPTTIGAFRDSARVAGCCVSIVRGGSAPNVRATPIERIIYD